MSDAIQQFRDALTVRGIIPPATLQADGDIHRCDAEGKNGKGDAAYVLHLDGLPAGGFENWRDGMGWQNWRADEGRILSPEEEAAHRAKIETDKAKREAEDTRRKSEAREKANRIFAESLPCTSHTYLTRKGIAAHGARLSSEALVLPIRDSVGVLHSLQFIGTDGAKRYLSGGRIRGGYYAIGKPNGVLCIAEGFATGASIHEATGHAVAVAFDAGNLQPVAEALRAKYPELELILCADDDFQTEGNPGISKATEAALSVGGKIAIPVFGASRDSGMTDFNDLAATGGLEAIKQAIVNAIKPARASLQPNGKNTLESDLNGWPEPHPLTAKYEPEPYPLDALPETIRAAVEEVAGFVKAPLPLVASSALAAVSLAIQAHADVKRAEKLQGPCGLYLLTIADSGERKSTCDGFFSQAIRDYEQAEAEAAKPILNDYQAKLEAWEAKRNGIKEKIRHDAKNNKLTGNSEAALRELEHDKPESPRIPRLLYTDATPEALGYSLAKRWPSGGVVSAEAGIVFGAHGMQKESAMRNLAQLNQLWDGNSLTIDRRTSESYIVKGARLTVALQVQEPTLRDFFAKSGALARGTGFLARFLIAWPESTQGQRPFTEPPSSWPALAAFNQRIKELLNQPAPIDEDGALSPQLLALTPAAKSSWVEYNNVIEGELKNGGELYDVRDVASKSADNAARLAALFHVFEGTGGAISEAAIESARSIALWHLSEARRFFGELALPVEMADAAELDSWLIKHCQREKAHSVSKRFVQQRGPVRETTRLRHAINELCDLDRLRLLQDGKRLTLHLNPGVLP